jgi:hypothetical protein
MRRNAKGPSTPIDEGRSHSRGFSTDAIEGVIGDEQHLVHADSHDLRRFCVRVDMWLEGMGNRHRDHTVKRNSVLAFRRFQHVRITIGQNDQRVARLQPSKRLGHLRKWSQPLDMSHEVTHFV